jgi:polar amino acid transport system substrate-binding protein
MFVGKVSKTLRRLKMIMKNIVHPLLSIVFLFVSVGYGCAQEVYLFNPLIRDVSTPAKPQSLRFVTVDGFQPFSAFDKSGTLRGVHVDLARAICAEVKLNAQCTLQVVDFNEAESLLKSGQADVALAGIVPTAENRNNLSFSFPYFRYPSKFLSKKDAALKDGAIIGVIGGSVHQKMAEILFPATKRTTFTTETEAIASLKANTISALFGDGLHLAELLSNAEVTCCKLESENYFLPALRPDTLRAATSSKRPEVLAIIDSTLRQMALDGRLDEIYLRYVPVNPLN